MWPLCIYVVALLSRTPIFGWYMYMAKARNGKSTPKRHVSRWDWAMCLRYIVRRLTLNIITIGNEGLWAHTWRPQVFTLSGLLYNDRRISTTPMTTIVSWNLNWRSIFVMDASESNVSAEVQEVPTKKATHTHTPRCSEVRASDLVINFLLSHHVRPITTFEAWIAE